MSAPSVRYRNASTATISVAVLLVAAAGCGDREQGHAHDDDSRVVERSASVIMAAHKHADPNETCFMCDPSKRDKGRLWCKEHVRYEDRCWYCHPELEDKDRLYCKGHFLYEDECFLCNPQLKDGKSATEHEASNDGHDHLGDSSAHGGERGLFCDEHGVYEAECATCQPDLAASLKPGESMKIRFPSVSSADKAGIRTGRPRYADATAGIEALCEVQYNLNKLARVTPLAGGVIRSVQRDVGDQVEAGDVLVALHSSQVASAKSAYLTALVDRDICQQAFAREKRLREQNIAAEKDYLEAHAALRSAELAANNHRQRLVNLGFDRGEVDQIQREQDTSARLIVRAPFDGTLVERNAVVGEAVEVGDPVFTVADLSSRWLILSIPSRHIMQVRTGQQVSARFNELAGVSIRGEITWIDTSVDRRSRMVKARVLVTDDAARIKTGLFGRARVVIGDGHPATLVPREAVQRHEGGTFVFVQDEADLFSIRRVALGQTTGQSVEVLAGLSTSDPVVIDGSFVVMSEFLKSRLGAGCADH